MQQAFDNLGKKTDPITGVVLGEEFIDTFHDAYGAEPEVPDYHAALDTHATTRTMWYWELQLSCSS